MKKGDPLGFLKIQFVEKNDGGRLETLKNFEKKSHKAKKGRGKSHSAEELKRGPFCFAMVLFNFMLEALDAFKIKYQVLLVKVHRAQKVVHTG